MKLWIMEIERFAIHDGPGIRSTIFLQGCPLHCPWCANPESQTIGSKLMYDAKKCVSCGRCMANCPANVIDMKNGRITFHREKCIGCKTCQKECLSNAIQFNGEMMSIEKIVATVLRDNDYYEESGGGVTVSGGECFVQFEEFLELIKRLKQEGLHTAVETCGQTSLERIKEAYPYIDLFLFDLKHHDTEKFDNITGGSLLSILENISYIGKRNPDKIIIRIPVIPEFNYDNGSMRHILNFVREAGIKRVHLLPYHTFGLNKYIQLDIPYHMKKQSSLLPDDLKAFRQMGEEMGLDISIGG